MDAWSGTGPKAEDAIPKQRSILRGFVQEKRTMLKTERVAFKDEGWKRPRFSEDDDDEPCRQAQKKA